MADLKRMVSEHQVGIRVKCDKCRMNGGSWAKVRGSRATFGAPHFLFVQSQVNETVMPVICNNCFTQCLHPDTAEAIVRQLTHILVLICCTTSPTLPLEQARLWYDSGHKLTICAELNPFRGLDQCRTNTLNALTDPWLLVAGCDIGGT